MAVLPPPAPGCASCAARDAVIEAQARMLEEQAAAIGELRADVVALAAEVRELRRRLGRNSGNSPVARRPMTCPAARRRRRSRSVARAGVSPAGSQAPRDRIWPGPPARMSRCRTSRTGRARAARTWPLRLTWAWPPSHQIVDVPLETARVTQHDLHEVACRCGRVHRAAAPAGAGAAGTVTYGLALQAWCLYLMAAHAIPVHRCAGLIEALTGAEPSPGFVHSM